MPEQIAAKYFNKKSAESAEIWARATGLEPVTYGLCPNNATYNNSKIRTSQGLCVKYEKIFHISHNSAG